MSSVIRFSIIFWFFQTFGALLADQLTAEGSKLVFPNGSSEILPTAKEKTKNPIIFLTFATNFISFISFAIVTAIFWSAKELRAQVSGKCWLMFSIMSLLNYTSSFLIFLRALGIDRDILRIFLAFFIYEHFFLEFSVYFWLCAICFETFYMIR